MRTWFVITALLISMLMGASASAQEATIHHGFLFLVSEKYTVDEHTYSIWQDGNKFEDLIKENKKALAKLRSYQTWHTMANVFTGLCLAAEVMGGFYTLFKKDLEESMGSSTDLILYASGGGFLVLGVVFEMVAWGSISGAAETYNKGLMDEGPALKLDPVPVPSLALAKDSAHLALTWRF